MTAERIHAKARMYLRDNDPRHRRGMTAQDTQLFDLEVDRLRGRRWTTPGRQAVTS